MVSLRKSNPQSHNLQTVVELGVTFFWIGIFCHMKGGENQNQPNNKAWNILAVFLFIFSLCSIQMVLNAQQDLFHYIFNIATLTFVLVSSIGVFAYSNNKAIFNRQFWVKYFYIYGLFTAFYNFHCFQHHSLPSISESTINTFLNVGVISIMTLYVLYRYSFIKNSF